MLQRLAAAITGRRTQERLAAVERAIRKLGEAERDRSTSVDARLADIARMVGEQPTASAAALLPIDVAQASLVQVALGALVAA